MVPPRVGSNPIRVHTFSMNKYVFSQCIYIQYYDLRIDLDIIK